MNTSFVVKATGQHLLALMQIRIATCQRGIHATELLLANEDDEVGSARRRGTGVLHDMPQILAMSPSIVKQTMQHRIDAYRNAIAELTWFTALIDPDTTYCLTVDDLRFFGFGRVDRMPLLYGSDGGVCG